MEIPVLEKGPKFTKNELDKIKQQFYKDKEFRSMFQKLKNAWLLQKIDMETWGEYLRKALEESKKRS